MATTLMPLGGYLGATILTALLFIGAWRFYRHALPLKQSAPQSWNYFLLGGTCVLLALILLVWVDFPLLIYPIAIALIAILVYLVDRLVNLLRRL